MAEQAQQSRRLRHTFRAEDRPAHGLGPVATLPGRVLLAMVTAVIVLVLGSATPADAAPQPQDTAQASDVGVQHLSGAATLPAAQAPADAVVVLIEFEPNPDADGPGWAPVDSQIMGHILTREVTTTVDGPVTYTVGYTVALPVVPPDLMPDDVSEPEQALRVYELAIGKRLTGSPYLEQVEQSAALSSVQRDPWTGELVDGALLIYAGTEDLRFPSASGEDGRLFTNDDETAQLAPGYTMATLSDGVFTLDRSPRAVVGLIDVGQSTILDLSDTELVSAFERLVDELSRRYAYGAADSIDWEELQRRYRPLVEEAAALQEETAAAGDEAEVAAPPSSPTGADPAADAQAQFFRALYGFAQAVGAVNVTVAPGPDSPPAVNQAAAAASGQTLGNPGISLVELEDGRVIVTDVAPGTPAAEAELRFGAEIVTVDGAPVADALASVSTHDFPGTPTVQRLAQVRDLLLAPAGTEIVLGVRDPGQETERAVTLTTGQFPQRHPFSVAGQPTPASYRFLDTYGYIVWPDFDRPALTIALLEDFLWQAARRGSDGIIIDLRGNDGSNDGSSENNADTAAMLMAAAFFGPEDPLALDSTTVWRYDERREGFTEEWTVPAPIHAPSGQGYDGLVTVLVDQACRGACELFAHLMQRSERAAIVGQYATAGGAGEVATVVLPGAIRFSYPTTFRQGPDADHPLIQRQGVEPDVRVPVVEEIEIIKSRGEDPVIDAAVAYLDAIQLQPVPVNFTHVGVTSVGPRSWRYDDETRQLRRNDGTALTVIPQQDEDVAAAVDEFVVNLGGTPTLQEELEISAAGGEPRMWQIYEAELFGRPAWLAGTGEAGDTLVVALFVANPDQSDLLYHLVLVPFLENFSLGAE